MEDVEAAVGLEEAKEEEGRKKAEFLEGEALVTMNSSLRFTLQFFTSEASEILSSLWALMMIPLLYVSQNKKRMYSFEDMDKEHFQKAFMFCFVDLALETVTYVSMVIFVMVRSCEERSDEH